ncbi:hypothetical protein LGH41_004449 [Escherichia coli]|nr:hypothetical protein [Escherichia coli]
MATCLTSRINDLALFNNAHLPDLNVSFNHEGNSHSLNIWGNGGAVLRVNWCAVPAMIERRQYHVSYEVFHAGRLFVKDSATSFLTIEQLHGLVILLVRDVFC